MPAALRHALVLTAGLGTRLRPLTLVRAKPAIPLAGEPLITHIARWLSSQGVTDLVLNLHYKPESITQVIGDGVHLGCRVRYSWEQPAVLGSAGGPRLASPIVTAGLPASAPFFIVNGDTLTDLALAPLAAAHDASGALVTMALVPNRHPDRYGGVRLDARGQVTGFARRGADARGSYHFIGVQLAQDLLDDVSAGVASGAIKPYTYSGHGRLNVPSGESMKTRTPFLPRIAYSAALPVSPEVAPKIFSFCPARFKAYSNKLPSNCIAISLKASVGPLDKLNRPIRVPFSSPNQCKGVISFALSSERPLQ